MKKQVMVALVAGLGLSSLAGAETLTVLGNVTAASCTASNATVTLPDVSVADFTGVAGDVPTGSTPLPFSVSVSCPVVGTSSTVTFDTSTGVDSNNLLVNTGAATGVGVEILDASSNNALLGTQTTALSGGSALFDYSAQYVETSASVTPGSVQASVGFTVTYN